MPWSPTASKFAMVTAAACAYSIFVFAALGLGLTILLSMVALLPLTLWNVSRPGGFGMRAGWRRLATNLQALEGELLRDEEFQHTTTSFHFTWSGGTMACNMHGLRSSTESSHGQAVLVVHGTAGSSMGFTDFAKAVKDRFAVHVLDMPGFGRSLVTSCSRSAMLQMSTDNITDMYCACLAAYIKTHRLPKVN